MASSTSSVANALGALRSPGFYYEADPGVGERASQPFEGYTTESGLKFYEDNFLKNERIAGVLKASFDQCNLTAYRTFAPDEKRAFQFRRGGVKADCILVVLLWPPDSEVIFYRDSWKHNMTAVAADNGLWRVPQASAVKAGLDKGTRVSLKQGGFTIHDGRTLVTFARGRPIAASFAPDEFLRKWGWKKRLVSTTEQMEQRLKTCENEKFKLYIEFARPAVAQTQRLQT
ncbi:hypothetical protein BR93DRAFT_965557 [Coniochaeta sp. PMI_546]|nr:hypothetical protein BR93DRAFT_965557 [Coniochaeta sp. PMI_546]